MVELDKEFDTTANFKKDPTEHLKRLKKAGGILVLSTNGKPAFVVQDARSYERLLQRLQDLETLEALRRSDEDARAGRVRPLSAVVADLKRLSKDLVGS